MPQPPHLTVVARVERSANRLLRALGPDDLNLLAAHLEPMEIDRGHVMIRPNERIEHVYFPVDCIGSVVAITPEGRRIEVGIFGRDGMSGTSVLLGSDRSPHESFVQIAGTALRMDADKFIEATRQSRSLHQLLLRYVETFQVQVAHTALSHGSYTIEERLARWLLMCHDRLDGDDLPLVHEFLALMLGVRRSGVTLALQIVEGAGVIRAKRGLITVRDRAKLLEIAGGSYGVPEAEYRRLIGEF
jgi:CRP-like cAMP-binding protein